jgi:hypothetical protein
MGGADKVSHIFNQSAAAESTRTAVLDAARQRPQEATP